VWRVASFMLPSCKMLSMDTASKPVLPQQLQSLINGLELYSRREILSTTSLPPSTPGVYAWFFKETPADVPINDCVTKSSTTLLYVGISPDKIGKPNSRQNLRRRITTHLQGNAEGSTLRRSLGVLVGRRKWVSPPSCRKRQTHDTYSQRRTMARRLDDRERLCLLVGAPITLGVRR